jgi:hypothetical protein
MAMPTRILIKVNLILIQNRTRKGSAAGYKDTDNFSKMLLVPFKPLSIFILGTGEWGNGGDEGAEGDEGVGKIIVETAIHRVSCLNRTVLGDKGEEAMPNPQSPIPNPQSPI